MASPEFSSSVANPDNKIQVTYAQYDMTRLTDLLRKIGMTVVLVAAIHMYFEITVPLIAISISQPIMVLTSELAQVHLFMKDPKIYRELRRPWPFPKGPFGTDMESLQRRLNEYQATLEADMNKGVETLTKDENTDLNTASANNKKKGKKKTT